MVHLHGNIPMSYHFKHGSFPATSSHPLNHYNSICLAWPFRTAFAVILQSTVNCSTIAATNAAHYINTCQTGIMTTVKRCIKLLGIQILPTISNKINYRQHLPVGATFIPGRNHTAQWEKTNP